MELLVKVSEVQEYSKYLIPIGYGYRPDLRGRLTLSRVTLLRKPWTYGDTVFHRVYRYTCRHTHFHLLQLPSQVNLHRLIERSSTDSL